MKQAEEPETKPEGQAPGDRLSRMSEAGLRITETLDLDRVLQGVVDGARSLTGARHAGATVMDDSGQSPIFVSSGLTPEGRQMRF